MKRFKFNPEMEGECIECNGIGHFNVSVCCGAQYYEPGYPDTDICTECKEHSEVVSCDDCNGTGNKELSIEDQQNLYDAELENKYEDNKGN